MLAADGKFDLLGDSNAIDGLPVVQHLCGDASAADHSARRLTQVVQRCLQL